MKKICFVIFLNVFFCSHGLSNLENILMQEHNKSVSKNYKNSLIEHLFAIVVQIDPKNKNSVSLNYLIQFFKKMFSFDTKDEFFYCKEFCKGKLCNHLKNDSKEFSLDDFLTEFFQNSVFDNSYSDDFDSNQKTNNFKLSKKSKIDKEFFIYYSNFDALKYATKFLKKIHKIFFRGFKTKSFAVFVLNDLISEEKLNTFIEFGKQDTSFIKNFYIIQQKTCKKINLYTENINDQILLKNEYFFLNNEYRLQETYYYQNLFFEILKYNEDFFEEPNSIREYFKKYEIYNFCKFKFGDFNTNQIFVFKYCHVTGNFCQDVFNSIDEMENTYLLFFYDCKNSCFQPSSNTLCISDKKYENNNFKNGKIVFYDQLENFTNFVYYLFKKDKKFNEIIASYCTKDFFLINNYKYPRSGIVQKISIKNTELTGQNVYNLLIEFIPKENITIRELEYQMPNLNNQTHKHYLFEFLKNIHRTKIIDTPEILCNYSNFMFEINYDVNFNISIIVVKKII